MIRESFVICERVQMVEEPWRFYLTVICTTVRTELYLYLTVTLHKIRKLTKGLTLTTRGHVIKFSGSWLLYKKSKFSRQVEVLVKFQLSSVDWRLYRYLADATSVKSFDGVTSFLNPLLVYRKLFSTYKTFWVKFVQQKIIAFYLLHFVQNN